MKLTGERDGEVKIFEVAKELLGATMRDRLPDELQEGYAKGKELIEAGEIERGVEAWLRVLAMAEDQNADWPLKCRLLIQIGDALGKARQWEKAHGVYRSALKAAQNTQSRASVWTAIGKTYRAANELEAAREAFGSAQEIREKAWGESLALAWGLLNLADLAYLQHRFDLVERNLQRALEISRRLAPEGAVVTENTLISLGSVARERGDLARAAEYFEEQLEIARQLAPSGQGVQFGLINLAIVAQERGDLVRATEYHEEQLEITRKVDPGGWGVADGLNNLGNMAADRGDLVRATEYYEKSLQIVQKLGLDRLREGSGRSGFRIPCRVETFALGTFGDCLRRAQEKAPEPDGGRPRRPLPFGFR